MHISVNNKCAECVIQKLLYLREFSVQFVMKLVKSIPVNILDSFFIKKISAVLKP